MHVGRHFGVNDSKAQGRISANHSIY